MSRNPLQTRLISIVEPVVTAAGLELVDLRFLLEQGGWVLRVQIDLPIAGLTDPSQVPSERISLTQCEAISRELSAVLDVDDPIKQAYSLEVSSPGIDRPLRTAEHFRHFIGGEAKIQLGVPLVLPTGERRNFRGTLNRVSEDGTAVTIDCDGQTFELALANIDHAKLVPDWDAVMRGQSGIGKSAPPPPRQPAKPRRSSSHATSEGPNETERDRSNSTLPVGSAAPPGGAGAIDPPPHSLNRSAAPPGGAGAIDPPPHSLNGSAAPPGGAGAID